MPPFARLLPVLLLVTFVAAPPAAAADEVKPNLILILADDLGYGDLGCYGSRRNRTPHLDRLAAEGIRFTDFHSNGPMCTATRAALMTGLYQQRFGREFEGALAPAPHLGLPLHAVTLPERLKEAGYATAIFGKWHLGNSAPLFPTRQGFDEFRGLVTGDGDHHTHVSREGEADWWKGEHVERETGYTADLLTRHSIDFTERHRDRPFFLYVPHLAIHFPWQGPDDPPHRQVGKNYAKDKWGLIPDRSKVSPHVQAMVESLDRSVGAIVSAVRRLGLERHTLVIFTSDNGGYTDYAGGFSGISDNGPYRGQKTQLYEGGHRVPAIAWWPGRIQPGTCPETALSFDLLPTFLHLAAAPPCPGDGVDLGDLLFHGASLPARKTFWRIGSSKAAREGPWKLVIPKDKTRPELYHLTDDPGETRDLAGQEPDRVRKLSAALAAWEQEVAHDAPSEFLPPRSPQETNDNPAR